MVAISVLSQGDIRKKLEIAFDVYDINKNGKIDRKEMIKLIEEIYDLIGEEQRDGENSPAEKVKKIMAQLGNIIVKILILITYLHSKITWLYFKIRITMVSFHVMSSLKVA